MHEVISSPSHRPSLVSLAHDAIVRGVTMAETIDPFGAEWAIDRREVRSQCGPLWQGCLRILARMEDAKLLRAWQRGDRAAGEELFERHYRTVERFFRNKVTEPDELIQRTFLACAEASSRFRGQSQFRTFLLGIAINILRSHYRSLQRERGIEVLDSTSMQDLGESPSCIIAEQEQERLLLEGLRRLPIELQLVLELRYWDGLKHHELAELLDVPRSTVNTQLRRARGLLEQHLDELATSPQMLQSTVTRLDDWVEKQRQLRPAAPRRESES